MSINKAKTATVITIVILIASMMTLLAQAQIYDPHYSDIYGTSQYLAPGVVPTNLRDVHSLTAIPSGVTPDFTYNTYAAVSASPTLVGVGQTVLFNLWCGPATQYESFSDYKVTITLPDGSTDVKTMNSYPADMTAWFEYAPDQVGTYSYKFEFPGAFFYAGNYTIPQGAWVSSSVGGDRYLSLPASRWYNPSSSGPYEFTVQQDLLASWPTMPLPTSFWTRPISPEYREWYPISGYFPSTGVVGYPGYAGYPETCNPYQSNYLFTPYVQAPNSAHVMWRRQTALSGVIGADRGDWSLTGRGNTPSMIYQGRCYDSKTAIINGQDVTVVRCYDLRDGYVYWERSDIPMPSMVVPQTALGEVTGAASGGYLGGQAPQMLAAVTGGHMIYIDPNNGNPRFNITLDQGVTSGTYYMGTDFAYFLAVQNLGNDLPATERYRLINWTAHGETGPSGSVINLNQRVLNNISWPFSSLGTVDYQTGIAVSRMNVVSPATGITEDAFIQAARLSDGALLWNHSTGFNGFAPYSQDCADHGMYITHMTDGRIHAWNLITGAHAWDNDISTQSVWREWFSYGIQSGYGYLISNQYNGIAAYNWADGTLAWLYEAPTQFAFDSPYQGVYAFFTTPDVIADGKVYAYTGEHTASQPIARGWTFNCINITDGTKVWDIAGSMQPGAVADGYITAGNSYDGYMYVFGPGPSKTTVSAPDMTVSLGSSVTIKGTVMDMSPGSQGFETNPGPHALSEAQPGTVPCVSADSMTTMMNYVYMGRPIDGILHNETITGVPVILTAIGSDGSVTDIGTTTSNGYYGTFAMAWTPPAEGTYTVTADFAGTGDYGSSSAATALTVGPAPSTPSTPEIPTPVDNSMLLYGILVAVIIAIILGLVAIFWKK